MKKFTLALTALALAMNSGVMAKPLAGYQDVLAAMKSGKTVYALVNYDKCTVKEKGHDPYGMSYHTVGIRMDHLFELTETRDDGKRMSLIGFAQNSWGGTKALYTLARQLIHVWEDNTVDVVEDTVDPTTFKLMNREWVRCAANGESSVTFSTV